MKRTNPFPYCYRDKDRQERPRWLLRLPGHKARTIKGTYGTPQFAAAYRAALESCQDTPKRGLGRTVPGTFAALSISYLNSTMFTCKRPETQRSERGIINGLVAIYGKCVVSELRQEFVQAMVDKKADRPSAARNRLAVLRRLMGHAIVLKWRKEGDNPALGVTHPKIKGKGFRPWTDEHCAKYEATHALGTRARLAYELLSCTALRRSDIVRVGRQHIRLLDEPVQIGPYSITHEIALVQQKTDEDVGGLLILPQLQAAIDAMPIDNLIFIVQENGKPLTKESFGNWFHKCCLEAGLKPEIVDASGRPKGLASHGLRKRMATRLSHLGCGDEWIAAVLASEGLYQGREQATNGSLCAPGFGRSGTSGNIGITHARTPFTHGTASP